jgi:hypothetical protein
MSPHQQKKLVTQVIAAELRKIIKACDTLRSLKDTHSKDPRPGGEIGRHKGLKIPRPQGHTGSIPVPGTTSFSRFSLYSPVPNPDLKC